MQQSRTSLANMVSLDTSASETRTLRPPIVTSSERNSWDQVRDSWSQVFASQGSATLKGPVDKLGLFKPLFARADEIEAQGKSEPEANEKIIREALGEMGVKVK
ncbi:hypothetical protein HNQ60_003069 [Povalibacter uvarum]|uniref:Uncharacterized protein n=1 Tax=Povalibacter uvarum TaxID=732238 RepID=A0A841HPZ7_9GAMM|nr:hypothetical protein [Povalibacter uvarum]